MSFNLVESFNAVLSDEEMKNEFVCSDRQYIYINDANSQNYNSGYINFNSVQLVGNDPKKIMDLNNSFLVIPYGCAVNLTGANNPYFGTQAATLTTLDESDALIVAPKGIHHIISQISLRMGGVTIHQPISYLNYWLNEKMKNGNSDIYRQYYDLMGFAWDSHESYKYDGTVLETNNNIIPSVNVASGLFSSGYTNKGHLERIMKNNIDLTTDTYLSVLGGDKTKLEDVFSPSLVGVYDNDGLAIPIANGVYTSQANKLIQTLVFQYVAILPLAFISDFIKNMPSVNTLTSFELRLLTNLSPNNSWSVTYGNEGTPYAIASTTSNQSVGETCPFMLSTISTSTNSGCLVRSNAPTITVYPFIGYSTAPEVSRQGGFKLTVKSTTPCQIFIPSVNLTDPYMSMLLDNKIKTVLYNDYQQDSTLADIKGGNTAQRLLTYQVSRLRKLYILPYLSNTGKTTCCDPRQSLLSSAPNTVSFAKISNLQVYLGSVNLYVQPQSYDFLHYINGTHVAQNITNGGDFRSLSVYGMIPYTSWRKCYNVYVVDLERVSDQISDDTIKNIQISFKNDTLLTYNYLILIEYQNEVNVDRLTAQIVASNNA